MSNLVLDVTIVYYDTEAQSQLERTRDNGVQHISGTVAGVVPKFRFFLLLFTYYYGGP